MRRAAARSVDLRRRRALAQQPVACIAGILFEPGAGVAEPEAVAPGVHVAHQALAADLLQASRQQDLQVADRDSSASSPPASRSSPARRSGAMQT
jgi:hypothetical protein